jgi:hypothetical protein
MYKLTVTVDNAVYCKLWQQPTETSKIYRTMCDSVTLLGAILGAIESLTWVPHVSDSMAPRMTPSNVTESESVVFVCCLCARNMYKITWFCATCVVDCCHTQF